MSENILLKIFMSRKIDLSLRHFDTMNFLRCKLYYMKRTGRFFSAVFLIGCMSFPGMFLCAKPENSLPQLGKSPLKRVIAAMTRKEKQNFVVGNGFHMPSASEGPAIGQTQDKVPG